MVKKCDITGTGVMSGNNRSEERRVGKECS